MTFRRALVLSRLKKASATWPIDPGAGAKPPGWKGWPNGSEFALVLTHDVESAEGVRRVRQLAEMEMRLGFRSAFNFVPRAYDTPRELREWLVKNGFEVGVHDLYHDGKLFSSEARFDRAAGAINQYLKEWGATGFRAGFMLRELNWIGALDVEYDCSTFDTDPFEPQPDGTGTIFPFIVQSKRGKSFVELPYTLPQDSTLFLLLREASTDIWNKKLEWVAGHQGMALANVHPDYVSFEGKSNFDEYPASLYEQFLCHIKSKYHGRYWPALPRDVAKHVRANHPPSDSRHVIMTTEKQTKTVKPARVWIDLDNTPHIPFFEPIIKELEARGHTVLLTARDAYQVCEMADLKGFKYVTIGKHYGKSRFLKVAGTVFRAFQLASWMMRNKPDIGLSHGSRAQIFLCNLFRLPSVLIMDYEFAKTLPMMRPRWEIIPEVISADMACTDVGNVRKYPGIKEDVYAPFLKPDPALLSRLGATPEDILVVVRPPATEAHYHNPDSERLFVAFMERVIKEPQARTILLPRNQRQTAWIKESWPHWLQNTRTIIPDHAIDGMNLLYYADLVISGGGTMNREATALGTPVYSIFRGPIGAVDRHLAGSGRLVMIETPEDVQSKIQIRKRPRQAFEAASQSPALQSILTHFEEILRREKS